MATKSADTDPLAALLVIDRLEVGPVRLEPQRLVATYTVHRQGGRATFDFIYRFEEDVFVADDPESTNLAAMMAAQVALNYGLFCREIVFHGPFDSADRRFLIAMARNTACEIFVKKFLEPNAFLKDAVRSLPPVRKDSYLQAQILFADPETARKPSRNRSWGDDRSRIAILSSGGKESLLSYSLLREAGLEPHSVFVNESGKHWFTALRAFRHFQAHIPNTARVWTNSDRLFSWMLRHLPFIREDFAKIRSDEYPIRLWTVAVFLFGVLPVLRKHGVTRLLVGDEFDTTDRRTRNGIRHYNGLYDQSRHFDQALSRFFHQKGWGVSQFSVVRPLSELLVEKVLVERYPDMQRLQTSCHAAHIQEEQVRPCGRCEKCARVVGMLLAVGADPAACGYTAEQIQRCLANLAEHGATQESPGLEQMAFLLNRRGHLASGALGPMKARERKEILKLRFDSERSPVEDVPQDLRRSLYGILLEHSDGAARRIGRTWVDYDPLSDAALGVPYSFEKPSPRGTSEEGAPPMLGRGYILGELTWPEARQRFAEVDVALLPVGAIEQHGPHLPLDTDSYDAELLAREVARRCTDPKPLVMALIPYGVSYHHDDFSGTISIGPDTLSRLVYEVGLSAVRHGISKLVIVNGHGGNVPALQFAAQLINRDAHIFTCVDSGDTSDSDVEALAETESDVHAGEIETSTSLANRPELVRMDKAEKFVPIFSSHYLDFNSKRSVEWYARTRKISPSGVMGDPTKATREKGERMWELMIEHLVALVEDVKGMSLDEIHQKSRY